MAADTTKAKAKLRTLNQSLDELETLVDQLTNTKDLVDVVNSLETLQQAKLNATIPYVVYDLIFIYLKSKGIDPKTHPVLSELDRIRQYFDKIKDAENSPQRKMVVDKAAAERFINHAIAESALQPPKAAAEGSASSPVSNERVPTKVTSKMTEREQYLQALREGDDAGQNEEEELQVFGDSDIPASSSAPQMEEMDVDSQPKSRKRKGKSGTGSKKRQK